VDYQEDEPGRLSHTSLRAAAVPSYLLVMRYLDAQPGRNRNFGPPIPADPPLASGFDTGASGSITAFLTATSLAAAPGHGLPADRRNAAQSVEVRGLLLHSRWENLLCATAIWEDRLRIDPRPVEPCAIVEEVLPMVEPLFQQRGQCVRVTTEAEGHLVSADPRRLAQVLINLILNASDYGGDRSEIEVRVQPRGAAVRVSLLDRGPGLAEEQLPGILELCDPNMTPPNVPMTLGLPLVRALVELHGGGLTAKNRRRGGARFSFELPAVRPGPPLP
jgi:K+-sensing histidine kinase KdpD